MPTACRLALGEAERITLEQLRDHGLKAYLRERAAVLLAIARGRSIRQAAQTAGLKPHDADTVCAWVARYQTAGLVGLWIRKGRGRKPASFPADAG
jgi:Helix-turn-helix domain